MYSICYKGREIHYRLIRKKVKNINLRVKPDLEVIVSARASVPLDYIKEFVLSKAKWILKHLDHYESIKANARGKIDYIDGDSLKYLGRDYKLKLFKSSKEEAKYYRGSIHLYVNDLDDFKKKQALIEDWYSSRCEIVFKESLDRMYKLVEPYNISYPSLHIRKMKSLWGSCHTGRGKIVLNSVLIRASKDSIDYVCLHELIHFKHRNHQSGFYSMLELLMPDWKERKKLLNEIAPREL